MYIMFCFWFPYIINLKILFIAYMDFSYNFSCTLPYKIKFFIHSTTGIQGFYWSVKRHCTKRYDIPVTKKSLIKAKPFAVYYEDNTIKSVTESWTITLTLILISNDCVLLALYIASYMHASVAIHIHM